MKRVVHENGVMQHACTIVIASSLLRLSRDLDGMLKRVKKMPKRSRTQDNTRTRNATIRGSKSGPKIRPKNHRKILILVMCYLFGSYFRLVWDLCATYN